MIAFLMVGFVVGYALVYSGLSEQADGKTPISTTQALLGPKKGTPLANTPTSSPTAATTAPASAAHPSGTGAHPSPVARWMP